MIRFHERQIGNLARTPGLTSLLLQ
jgi:hypothetical protein